MGQTSRRIDVTPACWPQATGLPAHTGREPGHAADGTAEPSVDRRVAELTDALHASHQVLAAELAEKERLAGRLGALLDALPGGVVVLDGQGRVAQFNPAASELLGALRVGEPWIAVVARAFAPRWDDGHDVSLPDGRRVNVSTAALPGEPGQILLLKDVSETRHLQDQLAHHRRLSAKTELAAVLAHQIRTPLATALLQLSNLARPAADTAVRQRARVRALEAIRQVEHLVNDMLTFARGTVVDPEPIAVGELLKDVCRAVAAQEHAETLAFTVSDAPAALCVIGNRHALVSVLLNLVDNARHAQSGAGRCDLSVAATASHVVLRVTDGGPGVPVALHEQIFEPFYTTRTQGTGLGLSAARAVARAHRGELAIDPAVTDGAAFVLTLPRADARAAAREDMT
ncbi:MAG: PAS domain-containing sensor histidine kinase [Gammaproteobacteria bacterium]